MTTDKPGIKIYEPSEKGVTAMRKASFRNTGPDRYVRLSDYEAMQAECENLRKDAARYQWLRDPCSGAERSFKSDIAETEKKRRLERDIASTIEKMMGLNAQNRALVEALESAYHLIANYSGEALPVGYASDQMDMIDAALADYSKGAKP